MAGEVQALRGVVVNEGLGPVVNIAGTVVPVTSWARGYTPVVGDVVTLIRFGAKLHVLSAVTAVPGVTPPLAVPPPAPRKRKETGKSWFVAVDSGTFQVGADWSFWGKTVVQWREGTNRENRGAWFYGTAPTILDGRTITGARIRLPRRLRLQDSDDTATAHLYLLSERTRPTLDVTRIAGPEDVSIPRNFPGGWFDLPIAFGEGIAAGGGIGLLNTPYLGFAGVDDDPASGQVELSWSRTV